MGSNTREISVEAELCGVLEKSDITRDWLNRSTAFRMREVGAPSVLG